MHTQLNNAPTIPGIPLTYNIPDVSFKGYNLQNSLSILDIKGDEKSPAMTPIVNAKTGCVMNSLRHPIMTPPDRLALKIVFMSNLQLFVATSSSESSL